MSEKKTPSISSTYRSAETWAVCKALFGSSATALIRACHIIDALQKQFGSTFTERAYWNMIRNWRSKKLLAPHGHGEYALTMRGFKNTTGTIPAKRRSDTGKRHAKPEPLEVRPTPVRNYPPPAMSQSPTRVILPAPSEATEFKIEKGIPLPAPKAFGPPIRKYPWLQLVVGDSFFVPCKRGQKPRELVRVLTSCANFQTKKLGADFKVRPVYTDNGARVWRVK